jgi:hypothetical protein
MPMNAFAGKRLFKTTIPIGLPKTRGISHDKRHHYLVSCEGTPAVDIGAAGGSSRMPFTADPLNLFRNLASPIVLGL